MVDVAKDGGDVEVWSAQLSNGHTNGVLGVDVEQALGEGFDGAVFSVAAVPVFWPALRNVFELVGFAVVFCTDDGRDGFEVCDTTGSVRAIGEEVWVESESGE